MTFFCSKCGYSGPVNYPHPKNGIALSGNCGYEAIILPPITEAERQEIMKRYGVDLSSDSSNGGAHA